jgi:hypothetical protein
VFGARGVLVVDGMLRTTKHGCEVLLSCHIAGWWLLCVILGGNRINKVSAS